MTCESPIFIAGVQRSGTTMFRLMLDHNPDVCIFGEFDYAFDIRDPTSSKSLIRYFDWLHNDRIFQDQDWPLTLDAEYPPSYREFLENILLSAQSRSGKKHIGAAIHRHFSKALELWPKARFIHLCRDPRDVARSWIDMGWSGGVSSGARAWRAIESEWDSVEPLLNGSHITVRYEELIERPAATLETVCSFLGVRYTNVMLQYDNTTTYARPNPRLANQWRHKISSRQRRIVECVCSDMMPRRGYKNIKYEKEELRFRDMLEDRLMDWCKKKQFRIKRYGLLLCIQEGLSRRLGPAAWHSRVTNRINDVTRRYLK